MPYLLSLLVLLLISCSSQPDPSTTSANAAYVHPRTCEGCHAQIALTYRQTGMARAFHKITPDEVPTSSYTHDKSGLTYQFLTRDGKVYLRRTESGDANPLEKEIHYVLGSGNHARSFLHRTPQGRLLEMPVNWYPENGGTVAMSPGYDRPDHMDMRRAIGYQCAFCHNGYSKTKGASLLDDPVFDGEPAEGIDCQRCHGPGREHASTGGRGKILNPKKLSPTRQMEVCMQCHLESTSFPLPNSIVRFDQNVFGYTPSQPLENYILHFDHARSTPQQDKFEIASSAYRLRQSRCFLASNDKLTCTTCHNPHKKTESADPACISCHQTTLASAKHAPKSDCASCHMPKRRTEDVIHVAVTDHKIQRPDPKRNNMAARTERHEIMGKDSYQGEVVPYYPASGDELYTALAQVQHQSNLAKGIPRLEAAIQSQQPKHPAFYSSLAQALHASGQPAKAIPWFEKALAVDPNFLPALRSLGATELQLNNLDAAKTTLLKATTSHPDDSLAWLELARLHRAQGNASAAIEASSKAIQLEPELTDAHKLLGLTQSESGSATAAESSFRAAIQLDPNDAESRFNLAVLLAKSNRLAEALPMAQAALARNPKHLDTLDLIANLHMATRNFSEAAAAYSRALELAPGNPRALLGLGTAYGAQGDFRNARRFFSLAANSVDTDVRAAASQMLRSLP